MSSVLPFRLPRKDQNPITQWVRYCAEPDQFPVPILRRFTWRPDTAFVICGSVGPYVKWEEDCWLDGDPPYYNAIGGAPVSLYGVFGNARGKYNANWLQFPGAAKYEYLPDLPDWWDPPDQRVCLTEFDRYFHSASDPVVVEFNLRGHSRD